MDFNNHSNGYNNSGENNGNNPYGNDPYNRPYTPPAKMPGSGLSNAAMILGIISIVSAVMMTIYFPFILGSVAIVLALLSKGLAPKLARQAKAGIACAIVGLSINLGLLVSSFAYIFANPSLLIDTAQMYDSAIEEMYGIPSEEVFGQSMEDMVNDMLDDFQ